MNKVQFQFIQVGSAAYEEMVRLRMKVLLGPIGIPRSYIDPQKEANDILIGAFDGEQLAACCILTRITNEIVQLRQMAVDELMQQLGLGRIVLSFAETAARENGYSLLMMHARDKVLPFYEKCGYHIVGEQFFEVGIGHHKMQKQLMAGS